MAKRYAVTIGTNYKGTPYELSGCVNDALDWEVLLSEAGYEVSLLVGTNATWKNILSEISQVVADAKWGDRIVITYSGHGTWVPDYNGDEIDGRDEAWCPDDMQETGLILDDDLDRITREKSNGVGLLFLSDSCHSGTVNKFLSLALPPLSMPRFLSPARLDIPSDERMGLRTAGISEEEATVLEDGVKLSRSYLNIPRTSLISGCNDAEYSYDAWFKGRPNGAFTKAAIQTYAPGTTLQSWHDRIRTLLPSTHDFPYPQTPQLSAASWYRRTIAKAIR